MSDDKMTAAEFKAEHGGPKNERQLQQNVCDWLDLQGITHYAVPNGQYRPNQRPEVGMQAGVPDLCIPVPSHAWNDGTCEADPVGALYIELKTPSGRLRDTQIKWPKRLTDEGNACAVCRSLDDVIYVVSEYLAGTFDPTDFWPEQQ